MKVLFTGATGVLGREAVPMMVANGHNVTGVARNREDETWLDSVGARPQAVDLFDMDSIRDAMAGTDTVIHYATSIPAQTAMTKRRSWETNDRLRSEATRSLVDAAIAAGVERFVQQSITFFYADGGDEWLDESSPIAPRWEVLESALVAEESVDRFRNAGGTGVTLRLSRLYGPGRASSDYIASVANRKLPIIGDGTNFISSLHTRDAATATVAALSAPNGTYNVSDDEPQRSGEHMKTLAQLLEAPEPRRVPIWLARIVSGRAVAFLTNSQRVSNASFKQATGWRPEFPSSPEGWRQVIAVRNS